MAKNKDKYVTVTKTEDGRILLTASTTIDPDQQLGLLEIGVTLIKSGFINNITYPTKLYEDVNV